MSIYIYIFFFLFTYFICENILLYTLFHIIMRIDKNRTILPSSHLEEVHMIWFNDFKIYSLQWHELQWELIFFIKLTVYLFKYLCIYYFSYVRTFCWTIFRKIKYKSWYIISIIIRIYYTCDIHLKNKHKYTNMLIHVYMCVKNYTFIYINTDTSFSTNVDQKKYYQYLKINGSVSIFLEL